MLYRRTSSQRRHPVWRWSRHGWCLVVAAWSSSLQWWSSVPLSSSPSFYWLWSLSVTDFSSSSMTSVMTPATFHRRHRQRWVMVIIVDLRQTGPSRPLHLRGCRSSARYRRRRRQHVSSRPRRRHRCSTVMDVIRSACRQSVDAVRAADDTAAGHIIAVETVPMSWPNIPQQSFGDLQGSPGNTIYAPETTNLRTKCTIAQLSHVQFEYLPFIAGPPTQCRGPALFCSLASVVVCWSL